MRVTIAPLFFCILAGAACSSGGVDATFPTSFDAVVLERTGCLGECPVYTVRISADGKVSFEGSSYVQVSSGTRLINVQRLNALEAILGASRFVEVSKAKGEKEQLCGRLSTDSPSAYVTVVTGSESSRLEAYYGCDPTTYLRMVDWVAMSIDQLSGTAEWVEGNIDATAEKHRNEAIIWASPVESPPN
jgi:hypothetical protein